MKYQMIMARSLPIEVTNGTLEGDIAPGDITFFRLQSTSDNKIRAYVAEGEVLPVAISSTAVLIFVIPSTISTNCFSNSALLLASLVP